jgi:CheY-like chemotaxis protein
MVTAYGDDERRRKASEYGAADFVTKPVDFDNLKRQLQQLAPPRLAALTMPLPQVSDVRLWH